MDLLVRLKDLLYTDELVRHLIWQMNNNIIEHFKEKVRCEMNNLENSSTRGSFESRFRKHEKLKSLLKYNNSKILSLSKNKYILGNIDSISKNYEKILISIPIDNSDLLKYVKRNIFFSEHKKKVDFIVSYEGVTEVNINEHHYVRENKLEKLPKISREDHYICYYDGGLKRVRKYICSPFHVNTLIIDMEDIFNLDPRIYPEDNVSSFESFDPNSVDQLTDLTQTHEKTIIFYEYPGQDHLGYFKLHKKLFYTKGLKTLYWCIYKKNDIFEPTYKNRKVFWKNAIYTEDVKKGIDEKTEPKEVVWVVHKNHRGDVCRFVYDKIYVFKINYEGKNESGKLIYKCETDIVCEFRISFIINRNKANFYPMNLTHTFESLTFINCFPLLYNNVTTLNLVEGKWYITSFVNQKDYVKRMTSQRSNVPIQDLVDKRVQKQRNVFGIKFGNWQIFTRVREEIVVEQEREKRSTHFRRPQYFEERKQNHIIYNDERCWRKIVINKETANKETVGWINIIDDYAKSNEQEYTCNDNTIRCSLENIGVPKPQPNSRHRTHVRRRGRYRTTHVGEAIPPLEAIHRHIDEDKPYWK
jgi:hypothetical protein